METSEHQDTKTIPNRFSAPEIGFLARGSEIAVKNLFMGQESNPYRDITDEELQEIRSFALRIVHGNFYDAEIDELEDRFRKPLADAIAHLGSLERSPAAVQHKRRNPYYRTFRSVIIPNTRPN